MATAELEWQTPLEIRCVYTVCESADDVSKITGEQVDCGTIYALRIFGCMTCYALSKYRQFTDRTGLRHETDLCMTW